MELRFGQHKKVHQPLKASYLLVWELCPNIIFYLECRFYQVKYMFNNVNKLFNLCG